MTDALAADRLLGESPMRPFAFGSYSKSRKAERANEWSAKNVIPILYREHRLHWYLHRTLRAWAEMYRDGISGKESIVVHYAPGASAPRRARLCQGKTSKHSPEPSPCVTRRSLRNRQSAFHAIQPRAQDPPTAPAIVAVHRCVTLPVLGDLVVPEGAVRLRGVLEVRKNFLRAPGW